MSENPSDQTNYKSSLPELKLPDGGFKSSIPNHLLDNQTPAMKWLMEEISKNTHATEFACKAAIMHNEHLRDLNGKTFRNEKTAAELKEEIASLKKDTEIATPIFKTASSFKYLWESRWFKVVFLLGVFVIVGIAYPYYIDKPAKVILVALKSWMGN